MPKDYLGLIILFLVLGRAVKGSSCGLQRSSSTFAINTRNNNYQQKALATLRKSTYWYLVGALSIAKPENNRQISAGPLLAPKTLDTTAENIPYPSEPNMV